MPSDRSAVIDFPISDLELDSVLKRSGMPTDTTLPFVLSAIDPVDCFSKLCGSECDLDELNYLVKRLDSFSDNEYLQYITAAEYIKPRHLKDFINLTFNLDKFTLIQDIGDMVKVGRAYELNTMGAIPSGREFDDDYAKKGRELLLSGKGIFTDNGLLFVEDKPLDEVYNGRTFPSYAYEMFSVSAELSFGDYSETVFLPCSDITIEKAAHRLGAKSVEECRCVLDDSMDNYDCLRNCFDRIIENEGITELNALIKIIENKKLDELTTRFEDETQEMKLGGV